MKPLICSATIAALGMLAAGPIPALPVPAAEQIARSVANSWTYMYTHERSAHTNGAHCCGRTFLLAVSGWAGDTRGDYRLLKQIRHNLEGSTCLVAAGGYGSQHERIFTASCVLIRHTPRLWAELSEDEKHRMDLLMKAALVASAYTSSDIGAADGQNTDMMGGRGLSRGWNPNFGEGMMGMMIVGTIWLGGADEAYAFLDNYDHAAFTEQLRAAGLENTYRTFNWARDHADSDAPTAAMIQRDIRNYTYMDRRLDKLMEIYWLLTKRTYGAKVNAGLNDGAGLDGAGKLASGAEGLPNVGKDGMLYEFDARDGGGPRSSSGYAYSGFRPNLINQIVMLTTGYWERGPMADECVALLKIGIPDLYYKLEHGYLDYHNGRASRQPLTLDAAGRDFLYMRSLWKDVVEPFHDGRVTCAHAGEDVVATAGEPVRLDGSRSIAAPGRTLRALRWLGPDNAVLAEGSQATVTLPRGTHRIVLEVTDSAGRVSRDGVTVQVR